MNERMNSKKALAITVALILALCGVDFALILGKAAPAYAANDYSAAQSRGLGAQAYYYDDDDDDEDDDDSDDADLYGEYGYIYGYGFQNIDGKKRFQNGPYPQYCKSMWIIEHSKTSHSFETQLPKNYLTKYKGCKFYYVGKDGVVCTGWHTIDGAKRYFNSDGVLLLYQSQIDAATKYRVNSDGSIHPGFMKKGKKTYYIMANGKKATGVKVIDNCHYYFNKKGVMQTGFVKIKGKRYFYDYQTGHKAGYGVEKGYIINYAKKGQCFKLKNKKTGNQDADAKRVAKQIAKCCKGKKVSKLDQVKLAAAYVAAMSSKCKYTMSGNDYYRAYGVFITKKYSCAGSTRALGMVLDYLKIPWKHVNENQNTHQWCKVKIGKKTGYADGMVGIVGYGKHPLAK